MAACAGRGAITIAIGMARSARKRCISSLSIEVILERHDGVGRAGGALQLTLDVELDPVRIGVGDVVAEVPGDFPEDRGVVADPFAVKAAELSGKSPAA